MAPDTRQREAAALADLPATELRARLARGEVRAVDLVGAFCDRIAASDGEVRAWAWHDRERVLREARAADALRASGLPAAALNGLPVGVKDIIDTAGIPTENGTPLDAGRVPRTDATVAARLRAAGAVIMGKTVTTELAFMHPAATTNPAAPGHTPGGSSSGSAAAVAAGHVPFAIGTQTGGSVIRPAAFCGIVGYKPTFGTIPRTGILPQSPALDTVGVFARTVADAALLVDALAGFDPGDPATAPIAPPRLLDIATARPPVAPDFAFLRPPGWDDADAEMRAGLEELAAFLGPRCFEAPLPADFLDAAEARVCVNLAEMAWCYAPYEARGASLLSAEVHGAMARGREIPAPDYLAALELRPRLLAAAEEILARADAIIVPAAPGPAPAGLGSTGDPIFNGLWTLMGVPAVSLPLLETGDGRPMGVQLIGRRGDDGRLLRTASWLMDRVSRGKEASDA
jgi:Asp-tRNA(Asn)/Glu-tRNA(Gln) amidotransferase A subunit family amidase